MDKQPKVIVSDEGTGIVAALKDMKLNDDFHGHHLLDCYHILKNVKNKLSNKTHLDIFKDLCS